MQGQSFTLFKGRAEMTPTSIRCLNLHTVGIIEESITMVEELCLLCALHHGQWVSDHTVYPVLLGPLLFLVQAHGLFTPTITHPCWQEQVSNPSFDFKISSWPRILLTVATWHFKFCMLGSFYSVLSFRLLSQASSHFWTFVLGTMSA